MWHWEPGLDGRTEASCSERAWTPKHSSGEGGDKGCVGGWFAANEHCGVPTAGAPSGLSGTEETGVSGAISLLSCSITRSPAVAESRRWGWLQFCSCLYFQFLLPCFKFLPHLRHALAAAAAFIVYIVSQESSVLLSGLFPGSRSTLGSPPPAGWRCGSLRADSPRS